MDINNYSYTPNMLDEDNKTAYFHNDDVEISIEKSRNYSSFLFWVSAWSYDGSMDFSEVYEDEQTAKKVYDYIVEKYGTTPPDGAIYDEIESLLTA